MLRNLYKKTPLPFCNNVKEADLHSEKFPLECRIDNCSFVSTKELGVIFPNIRLCLYPFGEHGSKDSVAT